MTDAPHVVDNADTAGTTVADAIRRVAGRLVAAGIDDARRDARLLVEAATGLSREETIRAPRHPLSAAEAARLEGLTQRRIAREPVTRILGERSFWGRTFQVTAATLDPRPETETLVELALDLVREEGWHDGGAPEDAPLILDIGTGTGCVLLTLLAELAAPAAATPRGIGLDVSAAALTVAHGNALRLGLDRRVAWQHVAQLADVRLTPPRRCLIVSNPPYIPTAEIAGLDPEVRLHDPRIALDGGPDGLDIIREIIAWSVGRPEAWLAIEHGAGQAEPILELIGQHCGARAAGAARVRQDLGGHTRCVAWKPHI